MSRTPFATKNGLPLRYTDTSENVHHIDVINQYISNHWDRLGLPKPLYIDSKSELYPLLLKTINEYAQENPENGETVLGLHYLYKESIQDYLAFALPKILFVPYPADIEEDEPMRPAWLRDSDIYVGVEFLSHRVSGYTMMTRQEIMAFDEYKDMYHDKYYGHIERFDGLDSDYISKDKVLMNQFISDLNDTVEMILSGRERELRYVRSVCY